GEVFVAEGQQVEGDKACRGLLGQQLDPAGGRMDALLQGLEVERVAFGVGDDDLAVDHRTGWKVGQYGCNDVGKVSSHRPLVTATDLYLVTVAEDDGPETVPFRLVMLARRDVGGRLGEHRRDRWHDGKVHKL